MKYCPNCQQNVEPTTDTNYGIGCLLFLVCIILGLVVPLWPITLPLFGGGGLLLFVLSGMSSYTCPICKLPRSRMGKSKAIETQSVFRHTMIEELPPWVIIAIVIIFVLVVVNAYNS